MRDASTRAKWVTGELLGKVWIAGACSPLMATESSSAAEHVTAHSASARRECMVRVGVERWGGGQGKSSRSVAKQIDVSQFLAAE